MTKLSADFYAFLNGDKEPSAPAPTRGWEAFPVGPAGPPTAPPTLPPPPTPARPLYTLSDVLHWCAPPAEVRAVLYAMEEAGRLGPAGAAWLRKWEKIHEPGALPELDYLPFLPRA